MNFSIHGDHIKVTESIKEYIESKISKLGKYFDNETEIEVVVKIRVRGENQIIEVTIPTKLFTIRAEERHEDLYAAVDLVQKKLESQIKKNKSKMNSKYKNKKGFVMAEEEFEEVEETQIVRRKEIEFKPMDEDEAILQMELLNHDFYLFKNVLTNKNALIYRRKDGNYGIIEEE